MRRNPIRRFAPVFTVLIVLIVGYTIYRRFAGPSLSTFYTVTEAAYNAFTPGSSDAPTETDSFPSGTTHIGVYYSVDNTDSGNTKVVIGIYDDHNKDLGDFKPDVATGDSMNLVEDLGIGSALPNGSYSLRLSINGKQSGTHNFTVGS